MTTKVLTWKVRTARAILALSLTPLKLIAVNNANTNITPIHGGKGKLTSPAKYEVAVAAETTEVAAKSRIRRTAPTKANVFVETFILCGQRQKDAI